MYGTCILVCVSGAIIPMITNLNSKIKEMKAKRAATCNSDPNQLAGLNQDSFDMGGLMISAVLAIVCMVCVLKSFGGTGSSGSTGNAPASVPTAVNPEGSITAYPEGNFVSVYPAH
jgi:hypothetical protein